METILSEFEQEVHRSPVTRDLAVKRLMDTRMPFPPYKVIDLQDMKSNQGLRAKLDKYHPFCVMHDQRVKRQMFLLSELFN